VVSEEEALVRGVEDDRVLGQPFGAEEIEQAADVVVNRGDGPEVILDVTLVGPTFELGGAQALGRRGLPVALVHVAVDAHPRGRRSAGPAAVIVVECLGPRDFEVVVQMGVFRIGLPRPVRGLVAAQKAEGPPGVAPAQPGERHVGDQVRDVAWVDPPPVGVDHLGIVVEPLAGQNAPEVESPRLVLGSLAQVPLADHRRLVPVLAEHLRERQQAVVEVRGQCRDAVDMIVRAGQNRRAARRADRVGAEATIEPHAASRDPVQVRRFVDAAAVATHCMGGMVVGHDEEDVRPGVRHGRRLLSNAAAS
jgi:hypothetical protein